MEKHISQEVDFMLINPKTLPDVVFAKLRGLVNFKEMLDYHFIEDCLK